ncbi:glycoside hydrolase superfamily [Aspergillus insuetus]
MASDPVSSVVGKLLDALTLEEKVSLVAGQNMWQTAQVERLGIRPLQMTDGPAGARGTKWTDGSPSTLIPCPISLAATWDPEMVRKVGTVLGKETRRKECHVLLAPTMNLSRSPLGGRKFESYGEDPFLIGTMSTEMIRGIQSEGVGACMKHFILNDTETRRFNVDQTIDERTLREVYPKINGIHADMSSFILPTLLRDELRFDRLVMSDWGGCNSTVESLVAGTDLEMPGPAVRRGERLLPAIRDGIVSEQQHLDLSVRRVLQLLEKAALLPSLEQLDGHAEALWQSAAARTEEPSIDPNISHQIVQEAAEAGLVLLKNEALLPLQSSSLRKVAIQGPNARQPTPGGSGSAAVNPFYVTTPEESLRQALYEANPTVEISYEQGIPFTLRPPLLGDTLGLPDGSKQGLQVDFFAGHDFEGPVVATTFWANSFTYMMSDGDVPQSLKGQKYYYRASGVLTPKVSGRYTLSIANTGKATLFLDNELLIDNGNWTTTTAGFLGCSSEDRTSLVTLDAGRSYSLRVDNIATLPDIESFDNTLFPRISGLRIGMSLKIDESKLLNRAVQCAADSDVVILVVGHNRDSEGEGGDRHDMDLPGRTNELIASVCAANPRTVVVVQAASAVTMPWAIQAPAIAMAWYQGQETGAALTNALLGRCNFSGKTPITFPRSLEDHGSSIWFLAEAAARDHAVIGEGVLIGYRSLDERGIEPLWPFGFGLSYTSFSLADLRLTGSLTTEAGSHITIHFTVHNTGPSDGHEVVQVYTSPSACVRERALASYPKALAGFNKVWVPAGDSRDAEIVVRSDELRWYDEEIADWRVDPGRYCVFVGTSVRDIKCTLEVELV